MRAFFISKSVDKSAMFNAAIKAGNDDGRAAYHIHPHSQECFADPTTVFEFSVQDENGKDIPTVTADECWVYMRPENA